MYELHFLLPDPKPHAALTLVEHAPGAQGHSNKRPAWKVAGPLCGTDKVPALLFFTVMQDYAECWKFVNSMLSIYIDGDPKLRRYRL
jgi:hypothetical protein